MDFKALEFAREQSEGSRWNPIEWLGQYIYTDIHDIFFSKFPIMLHEWFSKSKTQQRNFQRGEPKEWNPQLIERLEGVINHVPRAMYFWIDRILERYITEFVVDTIASYSEAE